MAREKRSNIKTTYGMLPMTLVIGTLILAGLHGNIAELGHSAEASGNEERLPPGYTDCGDGVPPSGPYLDVNESTVYDYDCILDTLVEAEPWNDPNTDCSWTTFGGVNYPVKGACALMNPSDESSNHVTKQIFMALVGVYETVDSSAHYHQSGPTECDDTGWVITFNFYVSYINQSRECEVNSCTSYWAHGTAYDTFELDRDFEHNGWTNPGC